MVGVVRLRFTANLRNQQIPPRIPSALAQGGTQIIPGMQMVMLRLTSCLGGPGASFHLPEGGVAHDVHPIGWQKCFLRRAARREREEDKHAQRPPSALQHTRPGARRHLHVDDVSNALDLARRGERGVNASPPLLRKGPPRNLLSRSHFEVADSTFRAGSDPA